MDNIFDTIAAPATMIAKSGVGIIRISGENALECVSKIFNKKIEAGKINHGWIINNGIKTDEVIVLYFKNPKSYTGEDVVEIQCHGSPVILKQILNLVLKNGARIAAKGEFTKRAFLNGKMDLSEAEAVLDLIESNSLQQAQKSAMNLSGSLSVKINSIRESLIEVMAKITASLDFPEDVKEITPSEIIEAISPVKTEIENILKFAKNHNITRDGIKIALAGSPNAGKSSLFNALLEQDRAIVTDIAGTTRDMITESFEIEGVLATLIDTAGIRADESADKVEQIGISQAKEAIKDADIVLLLFDSKKGITNYDKEIFTLAEGKKSILIAAKADLTDKTYEGALSISAKTNKNIDKLKELIYKNAVQTDFETSEFTTNQRQQGILNSALNYINNALEACERDELIDLISIDIKSALISLGEITGEVINDEILNNIFDKFCIGK